MDGYVTFLRDVDRGLIEFSPLCSRLGDVCRVGDHAGLLVVHVLCMESPTTPPRDRRFRETARRSCADSVEGETRTPSEEEAGVSVVIEGDESDETAREDTPLLKPGNVLHRDGVTVNSKNTVNQCP